MTATDDRSFCGQQSAGFSLLELLVTMVLMAALVTSTTAVLRSSQQVWQAHEQDQQFLEAAHGTLRHLTRQLRQATAIQAISSPAESSGSIAATQPDGQLAVWSHAADRVYFGYGSATELLAIGVHELSFVAYQADGITPTVVPEQIRSVQCTVRVELPRGSAGTQVFQSRIWLRSW